MCFLSKINKLWVWRAECKASSTEDWCLRYTAAQPQKSCLTKSQWHNLQDLFSWTAPNDQKLLAVIFLLAVKGVSKFRSLTRQLPAGNQRPEKAMKYILDTYPLAVPSSASLGSSVQQLVRNLLKMQGTFNFAQMLQGENVPANLRDLKAAIQPRGGEELLKFYVLYLLGFMSGLAGGKGSRFMTRNWVADKELQLRYHNGYI